MSPRMVTKLRRFAVYLLSVRTEGALEWFGKMPRPM